MKLSRRIITLMLTLVLLLSTFTVAASAAGNVMYGIGFVNATTLRLRSEPSTTSKVLDTAPKNECVVIISKEGDWYKVEWEFGSDDVVEAYIYAEFIAYHSQVQ